MRRAAPAGDEHNAGRTRRLREPGVHIENSFAVDAPADRVFAFLRDVTSVLDLASAGGSAAAALVAVLLRMRGRRW
jgi:hypothetical protein